MDAQIPPRADGARPVPDDETADAGTALCPALPPDLRYVDDSLPGYRRRRQRGKFVYFDAQGVRLDDAEEIARINKLAIPPAYTDVWICPDPQGHLQAVGRDARGRKQYRYHPRWREVRDADKYGRLLDFGRALPGLRARIDEHLALPGLGAKRVMAMVVALLDSTLIRVGNRRYAKENKSFGLTTLRNRHVAIRGSEIRFQFRGKSGIEHQVSLSHPRLARLLRRCLELPGQHLFQYLDEDGSRHAVTSTEVNLYLQTHTGGDFTAKDYRTWAGSALALQRLRKLKAGGDTNRQLIAVIKEVAAELGNTPTICRQCYIHPMVIEAFLAGELTGLRSVRARKGQRPEEATLLRFLEGIDAR